MVTLALEASIGLDVSEELSLVAFHLREGLSERTHATVEVACTTGVDFAPVLAGDVTLAINDDRRWSLKLGGSRYLGDREGSYRYLLELYDAAWLLTHTEATRKFRNLNAREIVNEVLGKSNVARGWSLQSELPKRKYCVQYDESDLHFVERLLAFEGVYYAFEQDGTMLMADTSPAAPSVPGADVWDLVEGALAMQGGAVGIHHVRKAATLSPGSVTLGDHSWKTPNLQLRESAYAERDGDLNWYDYLAGFRNPDQGKRLAELRLQEKRALSSTLEGRGSVVGFAPGYGFTFGDAAGAVYAGDFLLVRCEHRYRADDVKAVSGLVGDDTRYENQFVGIPLDRPFRPPQKERPDVGGSHTAMVRGPQGEEIHTDSDGRFRAQHHWDRDAVGTDDDSRWLRKLQEVSTSQALARVGWEMYVNYVDGDPDRPMGIGRAINGAMPPEYALPASKNMLSIKTPSSPANGGFNEINMDDSAGSQAINVRAEKDLNNLVKNDKTETVGNNETRTVGNDLARQVTGVQKVAIGANQAATVGNNADLLVEGDRTVTVGGNETIDVVEGKGDTVGGNDTETVGGSRITIAGSFTPPDLGKLAESAAQSFVAAASPGGKALYDKLEQFKSLAEDPDKALGALQDKAEEALLDPLKDAAKDALKDAGKDALEELKKDYDLGDAAGVLLEEGQKNLGAIIPTQAQLQAQLEGLIPTQAQLQAQLDGLKANLDAIIPTKDTLSGALESGLDAGTGGLYSSLRDKDFGAALTKAIDLFFTGGITRNAEGMLFKVVGGAYITVAIGNIDWMVGHGYAETVLGAKVVAVIGENATSSDGVQLTTVGGAILRSSVGKMSYESAASSIAVGGAMTVEGKVKIEVTGGTVKVSAASALNLSGGGAKIEMTPGAITITGNVNLNGTSVVKTTGTVLITQ